MAWTPVISARYAKRGAGGTTAMEGVTRFRILWNEQKVISQDAQSLAPNAAYYTAVPLRVEIETENLAEIYTLLTTARSAEKLVVGYRRGDANRKFTFNCVMLGEPRDSDFPPAGEATGPVQRQLLVATVLSPAPGDAITAIFNEAIE